MYSNQKQSVILSSKRNTAFLMPSSSLNGNSSTSSNLSSNENPFPVNHISNSKESNANATTNSYSDEETSDDDLNDEPNKVIEYDSNTNDLTSPTRVYYDNNPLTSTNLNSNQVSEFLTPLKNETVSKTSEPTNSGTSSISNTSSNLSSIENTNNSSNFHVNQYYYHVQQIKQNPNQIIQSDLNRNNYIPHQKTDRVVAIKNNHIINNNSKNIKKLQQQQQQQIQIDLKNKAKTKDNSNLTNISSEQETEPNLANNNNYNNNKLICSQKNANLQKQESFSNQLNHSISSENGKFLVNMKIVFINSNQIL